jgi:phosphoribosylformylglycinamidine (FGAM) synthase-like enzyme
MVISFDHEISDRDVIMALLEMAFVGNCGIHVNLLVLDIHGIFNVKFVALFAKEQQRSW